MCIIPTHSAQYTPLDAGDPLLLSALPETCCEQTFRRSRSSEIGAQGIVDLLTARTRGRESLFYSYSLDQQAFVAASHTYVTRLGYPSRDHKEHPFPVWMLFLCLPLANRQVIVEHASLGPECVNTQDARASAISTGTETKPVSGRVRPTSGRPRSGTKRRRKEERLSGEFVARVGVGQRPKFGGVLQAASFLDPDLDRHTTVRTCVT
jgi:hypothetical protein